ncbi:MAG: cysteine synthase family protein [Bacteriovoracaceae bacterium]|nr:cysteine synthase family protein [Bacteriovoracaceae bacterium]
MRDVVENVTDLIGNTPIVKVNKICRDLPGDLYLKLEYYNPGGSIKDRIGKYLIQKAIEKGEIKEGGTIIEATAGNTGIGLAMMSISKDFKTIFVIPDKMSAEKVSILNAMGAKIIMTRSDVGPEHPDYYSNLAYTIQKETPNSVYINQFNNEHNQMAHYNNTAPEIWQQMEGKVDAFVAGAGSGGTISGCGRYLKEKNKSIDIVLADPEGSILAEYINTGEKKEAGSFLVEGIGEDYIPPYFDASLVDYAYTVSDQEAFLLSRRLLKEEGVFAGTSAGAIVAAAAKYMKIKGENKTIVAIVPDSSHNYLSKIYNDEWLKDNKII